MDKGDFSTEFFKIFFIPLDKTI